MCQYKYFFEKIEIYIYHIYTVKSDENIAWGKKKKMY